MTDTELKACPCGVIPKRLNVLDGSSYRYRQVDGGCCGYWEIEVRVNTMRKPDVEADYAECVEGWNEAPRYALSGM